MGQTDFESQVNVGYTQLVYTTLGKLYETNFKTKAGRKTKKFDGARLKLYGYKLNIVL